MKNILILLLIVCSLTMSACSTSNNADVIDSNSNIDEKYISQLFDNVFVKLTNDVGTMSFDECLAYIKSTGFRYKANTPSKDEPGEIKIEDENDFYIIMFFEFQNNESIFYNVVYSNGNFEGSVMYNSTKNEKSYRIYDITSDEKGKSVNSLDDVISFIKNEVPQKQKQYSVSVSDNNTIDVMFDISHREENGKVFFDIQTNLPDNMILMLSLTNDDYYAQNKVTVSGGVVTSSGFSNKGNKLVGHYKLEISSIFPNLQSNDVISQIGSQGEFLTGKYVTEKDGMKMISAIFEFNL